MAEKPEIPFVKQLDIIEKHLDKNEKWFQYPEGRMLDFDKMMSSWNTGFLEQMQQLEKIMKDLEKQFGD
ncbi:MULTISPECIES: hypothetical protein [unclassified Virgibacillus]|uniref:hypothetical protein n=1 Tax=unclassified Virgibacillus TaxID=2620237 RepID=UPI0024DEE66B|nr:hypothetical protein [Virgibacillus sp. LDC-1]